MQRRITYRPPGAVIHHHCVILSFPFRRCCLFASVANIVARALATDVCTEFIFFPFFFLLHQKFSRRRRFRAALSLHIIWFRVNGVRHCVLCTLKFNWWADRTPAENRIWISKIVFDGIFSVVGVCVRAAATNEWNGFLNSRIIYRRLGEMRARLRLCLPMFVA